MKFKNLIKITGLVCAVVMIVSCSKNKQETKTESQSTTEKKVSQNVLYTGNSVYAKSFVQTDYITGFSSLKENAIAKEHLSIVNTLNINAYDKTTKSASPASVFINGVELTEMSKRKSNLTDKLYGQKVEFVVKSNQSTKGEGQADTVEMYIPELVKITSPEIKTQSQLYPRCYYKNFKLGWAEDSKNENGLVVMVEWQGTYIDMTESKDEYIRNIDVIEDDDGEVILNEALFDGIPHNALAYITLLRGNIEVIQQDTLTYRTFGESHEVLPLVLIKEL